VAEVYGSPRRPRRSVGRRLLTTVIVLLILLGIALAVADRVGASYAERVVADRVAQQLADQKAHADRPDVTIEGVPFLTQVVAGRYREIKILLRNFSGPAGNDKTIRMPLLDVRAKDVRAPLDTLRTRRGAIVATRVTGTGTVDYATVAALVGQPGVKLGEKDGKLAVTAPLKVLNQTVTVAGTAALTVHDNIVSLHFDQVTAQDLPSVGLLQDALNSYARRLSVDFRVPALPFKLAVQKVQPAADGLHVTAAADEVPLNAGGV
jgi:LmeA-like phospholipid-binding